LRKQYEKKNSDPGRIKKILLILKQLNYLFTFFIYVYSQNSLSILNEINKFTRNISKRCLFFEKHSIFGYEYTIKSSNPKIYKYFKI